MDHSMNTQKTQLGSTLAISLVILTAVTIISVTAMQRSGLQGRMVGNIQFKERAFQITNSDQESIFQFYSSQSSATKALSAPLNSFNSSDAGKFDESGDAVKDENNVAIIESVRNFTPVSTGHKSAYSDYNAKTSKDLKMDITSNILHTGESNSLVEGFSIGTFVEFGFITTTVTSNPVSGKELSSQSSGIKYIAPAG